MNVFFVYILYSKTMDQYYGGMTTHPRLRLKQHLRGQSKWSSRADDWVCVYKIKAESMAEARALEKHIKACGARRYIERMSASQSRQTAGQG